MFHLFYIIFFFISSVSLTLGTHVDCCINRNVPKHCAEAMCNSKIPPGDLARYSLFEGRQACTKYLLDISKCLTDGRDSTSCCIADAPSEEESACFGMCNGTMVFDERYEIGVFQSCYAINADSMYKCIHHSHHSSPTPPQNLRLTAKSAKSVTLEWEAPLKNPEHLHAYRVHVIQSRGMETTEVTHDTKEVSVTITKLNSTYSYSAFVVSLGKHHRRSPDFHKSTFSNIVHFTTLEDIALFKKVIRKPKQTNSTSLSCHLKTLVGSEAIIEWEKLTEDGLRTIELSDESRFKTFTYASDPVQFIVSTLEIKNLENSDFGTYRCHIKGASHEYGETNLVEYSYSDNEPATRPPFTLFECCSAKMHRPHCTSICGESQELPADVSLRPGNYIPPASCFGEFNVLLKCTLSFMNSDACCIKKEVPYDCLGLCDSGYGINALQIPICMAHMKDIYACQLETTDVLPDAVSHVKNVHDSDNDRYEFTWEKSAGSKIYHIFTRKSKSAWSVQKVESESVTVSDIDEIAIVAVNDYGVSTQSRWRYFEEAWIPNRQ